MNFPQSIEDIRRYRYQTIEEFAKSVGISPSTYYRVREGRAEIPTMRQIAAALQRHPSTILEFLPEPSPAIIGETARFIDDALEHGWLAVDPETLEPTGQRVFENPFAQDSA